MALLSRTLCARVELSGEIVLGRILDVDEQMLVEMARNHVRKSGLDWKIREPYAWKNYGIGPHVTLAPSMKRYVGEYLPVKLDRVSHFIDSPSRWVVFEASLPQKFRCSYECHVSIGQERFA